MNPSVGGEERARQRRLVGVLLAAPFVLAPATVGAALPAHGAAGALAMLCAVFATFWLIALHVAVSGRGRGAERAALVLGAGLTGVLIALSGGLSTPVAALALALPLESAWVSGSRRGALRAGLAASGGALLLALAIGTAEIGAASAWLWVSPLLHLATIAARSLSREGTVPLDSDEPAPGLPDECFDAVVARIGKGGEVETASAQTRDLLRIEPELLLGSGLFERIHVADRVEFRCAVAQVHDSGRPRRCAMRLRMPMTGDGAAGHYRPFEAEIVRPRAADGTVVAIIRDGSEAAALRDELAQARERAEMTEVTKGRFLATVSHELRTPLNAIIGFSDMLLHPEISGTLAARQAEHVTLIREAGGHLLSVVNAILDVSKIEAGAYHISLEPFELRPAVELCRAMLQPQADAKGVALTTQVPQGAFEVMGDQRAVQQILLNLLSNAIKFTPQGGRINVGATRQKDRVRIFVDDTGIGIGAEDLARLGKPFSQVRNDYTREYQGTGLGLSLVKGLVELHGGAMSIESAPGLGTTVTVTLPAAAAAAAPVADIPADIPAAARRQRGGNEENNGIALHKIA